MPPAIPTIAERIEVASAAAHVGEASGGGGEGVRTPDPEGHGETLQEAEGVLVGLVVADVDHADRLRPRRPVASAQDVQNRASLVPADGRPRLDRAVRIAGLITGVIDDLVRLLDQALPAVLRDGSVVVGEGRALELDPRAFHRELLEILAELLGPLAVVHQILVSEIADLRPRDLQAVVSREGQGRVVHQSADVAERPPADDRDVRVAALRTRSEGLPHPVRELRQGGVLPKRAQRSVVVEEEREAIFLQEAAEPRAEVLVGEGAERSSGTGGRFEERGHPGIDVVPPLPAP
jgi:hypothetical protein